MAKIPISRRFLELLSKYVMVLGIGTVLVYTIVISFTGSSKITITSEYLRQQLQKSADSEYWKKLFLESISSRSENTTGVNEQKIVSDLSNNVENVIKSIDTSTITSSSFTQNSVKNKNKKKIKNIKNKNKGNGKQFGKKKSMMTKKPLVKKPMISNPHKNISLNENKKPLLPSRSLNKHPKKYEEDVVIHMDYKWTPERASARQKVFKSRNNRLQKICNKQNWRKYKEPTMAMMDRFLRWSPKYNLLWCPIFKAASTTWVKNFLSLAGEVRLNTSLHGRVRELYAPPDDPVVKNTLLTSAMKLIIVRHPLDRLLSAYRDKMLRVLRENDPYHLKQLEISSKYEDPYVPNTKDITTSHNDGQPSFNQFLLRVRDDMKTHMLTTKQTNRIIAINLHWRPYWTTCAPCQMNYDFIAKVETLDEDQEYVIHEAQLEGLAFNARTHASNFDSYNGTSEATTAYFSSVPRSLLTEIIELYKPDFEMFNYSADEYLRLTVPNI